MNTPEVKQFIRENQELFWYIDKTKLEDISHEVLVEFILNYGDLNVVKKLFELLGLDYVAEIFYKQVAPGRRINYFPKYLNFFKLYFDRHASRDIVKRANRTATSY